MISAYHRGVPIIKQTSVDIKQFKREALLLNREYELLKMDQYNKLIPALGKEGVNKVTDYTSKTNFPWEDTNKVNNNVDVTSREYYDKVIARFNK